ncbi:LytR C-terminal domain-containing protein [Williamsia maris]|uniref:LytR cell envelope-related transcriptional attenuator n=1 Tax=Williamsia maris TaxID=72806 RepID=A0ABT1HCF2_9NOCA|nr:LytR C-terminal domain-containing protein [Williamsia maris]MCP2175346.1 LytR cell envelope-related transcriptional attenuator [Williamsia maris]
MTPDREPNRLPFRAGAMLLLAIAVVCIGLGWHSAVTTKSSPEADLRAAAASGSASSAAPSSSAAASTSASASGAGSSSTDPSSSSTAGPLACVYNAGSISGLAVEVTASLKSKGWRVAEPGNLQSASITENTVFYSSALKSEADRLVSDLGNDATADLKPSSFTQCRGGLAVVVITR